MADYAASINTNDYLYRRPVYFTENTGSYRTNAILKLVLDENNFNFDLAKSDGSDFRLAEKRNGSAVLNMWIAQWSNTTKHAVLFFKLPAVGGGTSITLQAFWGNSAAANTSDSESIGALLAEDFNSTPLDASKWVGDVDNSYSASYGYYLGDRDEIFLSDISNTIGNILADVYGTVTGYNVTDLSKIYKDSGAGTINSGGYVQIEFNTPQCIKLVRCLGDSYGNYGNGFYLYGSDTGVSGDWDLVYTVEKTVGLTELSFGFNNTTYYKYYRIKQLSGNWRLESLEFYGDGVNLPLIDKNNWILEAGVYLGTYSSGWDADARSHGFLMIGSENGFVLDVGYGSYRMYGVAEDNLDNNSADYISTLSSSQGGLQSNSYQEHFLAYHEPTDSIIHKLLNRSSYSDNSTNIYRKVEGDTRIWYPVIRGRYYNDGANPSYISWLIIREFDTAEESSLDGRDLYIENEDVPHQNADYKEYGPDLTATTYAHESSFGGDPTKLSDEFSDTLENLWISDADAVSESYISATIHLGWEDDVSSWLLEHRNSSNVAFYQARKLSDDNQDEWGRDHWWCTTTSGWASIDFGELKSIGAVNLQAYASDLDTCPKDYVFYGSNTSPFTDFYDAKGLVSGQFTQSSEWQAVVFNNLAPYRYYILDVLNTYGDEIRIQEWRLFEALGRQKKKYVSQLRILPASFSSLEDNFPKEISLQASKDLLTWDTLIPWTDTYSPYYEHYAGYGRWQRYSFDNTVGYWSYRLLCRGNWGASDGKIIIAEWSLHELASEANTERILAGSSNDIKQVWATDNYNFDNNNGLLYMTNDKLNTISNTGNVESEDIDSNHSDINVI
jgi:hypothetical protein